MTGNLNREDISFSGKAFRYLKELILSVVNLPYEVNLNKDVPLIKNIDQTINLLSAGASIARFGDGEFRLINGFSIPYQKFDLELRKKLINILQQPPKKLLIGLPETFSGLSQFTFSERIFWRKYMSQNRRRIYQLINIKRSYVSSFFSRPYLRYRDKTNSRYYFHKIKTLWDHKKVLIVEGNGTRFGVGNDLLSEASEIKRILCPDINAFSKYSKIYQTVLKVKTDLVLIALGPTAKVLADELCKKGVQAIDVGHLDIEYEWFLQKTKRRLPIAHKNVLEVKSYPAGEFSDPLYQSQIVATIK